MRFDYSDSNVAQGRANQELAKENPTTFGRESNTEKISQYTSLDKPKQRMAGEMGSRIIEYLQNPDEKARTDSWLEMFEMSNQGQEFNKAKLGMSPEG